MEGAQRLMSPYKRLRRRSLRIFLAAHDFLVCLLLTFNAVVLLLNVNRMLPVSAAWTRSARWSEDVEDSQAWTLPKRGWGHVCRMECLGAATEGS